MPQFNKNLYIVFAVLLAVIGVFMGYLLMAYLRLAVFTPAQIVETVVPVPPSTDEEEMPVEPQPGTLNVQWQAPEEITVSEDLVQRYTPPEGEPYPVGTLTYFHVGTVRDGAYAGADVLVARFQPEGPAFILPLYRLLRTSSGYVVLTKQSDDLTYAIDISKVTLDNDLVLPGFDLPERVIEAKTGYTLMRDPAVREFYDPTGLVFAFHQPEIGDMYTLNPALSKEAAQEVPWVNRQHGFASKLPDGTIAVYSVVYEFVSEEGVPQFSFADGMKNTEAYHVTEFTSCGSTNYANVVSPDIVRDLELMEVGATQGGVKIFALKDANHPDLLAAYEMYWVPEDEEKITYEDFVKRHPMLFFTDRFNRLVKMRNASFIPPAECGKPVIYLYPEQEQAVSVRVAPQGGFTYTEPVYGQGWEVVAKPDGSLTNVADGVAYPYLFWEGNGGIFQSQMEKGFVVEREGVEQFLTESLAALGLNGQETADFIEFWLPRMQSKPYYFITFYGNETMDALAPLTVEPQPDTVIRVLMDFAGLEEPIEAQPYPLHAPQRQGFTVVEWGGVLHGE